VRMYRRIYDVREARKGYLNNFPRKRADEHRQALIAHGRKRGNPYSYWKLKEQNSNYGDEEAVGERDYLTMKIERKEKGSLFVKGAECGE